jgi:NADPH2:quinone reductase
MGTAGIPSRELLVDAMHHVMAHAATGDLRIETERVPLADIESAWQREGGRRLVVLP